MVRKRGGASSQGGGKRTATSPPVGATYKDSRRNIQGDEDFDDEDLIIHNKQKSAEKSVVEKLNQATVEKIAINQQSRKSKSGSVIEMMNERASLRGSVAGSLKGAATGSSQPTRKESLGADSLYKTPAPEGCMRDVITVVVETRDRENYRGTVTYEEAKYQIFLGALDLPEELLHGVKIQFGEGPTITFKLTEQIDVDTLAGYEYFAFERKVKSGDRTRTECLGCKIKGIRARRKELEQIFEEEEQDSNVMMVTISGCDYSVEEEEMREWLSMYGEVFGTIAENTHKDEKLNAKPTGSGTYSAKMRVDRQIPQFLPMYGKKVRVDHRGQENMCTNCYGRHHRKMCRSDRVEWMSYVVQFMRNNPNVSNSMIGRWFDIAQKERRVPREGRSQENQNSEMTERIGPQRSRNEESVALTHNQYKSRNKDTTGQSAARLEKPHERNELTSQPGVTSRTLETRYTRTSDQEHNQKKLPYRTLSPARLKHIMEVREEYDNPAKMERLYDLTELGLTLEAAREMYDSEMEIKKIDSLLQEKKKKQDLDKSNKTYHGSQAKDGVEDQAFRW